MIKERRAHWLARKIFYRDCVVLYPFGVFYRSHKPSVFDRANAFLTWNHRKRVGFFRSLFSKPKLISEYDHERIEGISKVFPQITEPLYVAEDAALSNIRLKTNS